MFSGSSRFLICIPRVSGQTERTRTVGRAVVRIADMLGADIEVSSRSNLLSVWVYYKNGEREWSPVYFDWGKDWSEEDAFRSIRSEVHCLSSLSENLVLQSV